MLETVAVVGAGTMGCGIAQVCATAGLRTLMFDAADGKAQAAKQRIAESLHILATKKKLDTDAVERTLGLLTCVDSLAALREANVVIEAAAEELPIKKAIFRDLELNTAPDALLTTNTSSLAVTAIAGACDKPDRIAGFHFFNPPPVMKLVEVIAGLRTSPDTIAKLVTLARRLGKTPIEVKDSPGFLVNHVGRALMPEALRIVTERIASPEQIDTLVRDCARFRMGPFELLDLVGADVAHAVMESIYGQYYGEPRYQPSTLLATRVSGRLLGRKTGQGFYAHDRPRAEAIQGPASAPDGGGGGDEPVLHLAEPHDELSQRLQKFLAAKGVAVTAGAAPANSVACITPLGEDCSHACVRLQLDPRRTVAFDMLIDDPATLTLMTTPLVDRQVVDDLQRLLRRHEISHCLVRDSAGFVVQRLLAMIVNVGTRIAELGIASPGDIDMGAKLGLNYPEGPLELGDRLDPRRVVTILDAMFGILHDPKYAATAWLRRRAVLGCSLSIPD